jgi:release factor glutamine methyltransferase
LDIREARRLAASRIAAAGIERPWLEADLLLCFLTGMERSELIAHQDRSFPEELSQKLDAALLRRTAREPLQYITGTCSFMGMPFKVGPGCLVPRPETELLVLEARRSFQGNVFVDWGTGSGCIASAVLADFPESRCIAVDKSPRALSWAWKNLRETGLLGRCLLCHAGYFDRIPVQPGALDMIISNPPYIPACEMQGLMPEVALYEPEEALAGGDDGLELFIPLIKWAARSLRSGGVLILEAGGEEQIDRLVALSEEQFSAESVVDDIQGIPRVVVLKRSWF